MAPDPTISDRLRLGQRRAEEVRQTHGVDPATRPWGLTQEAQALIPATRALGLPQLFAQDRGETRKRFSNFLTQAITPASTPEEVARVSRIGTILTEPDNVTAQARIEQLDEGDREYLSDQLRAYNPRLELAEACANHIDPREVQGLFAGNPNLERLFADAGADPEALKRALHGAFEWATSGDEGTFRVLYGVLNNFARHKSAEKRLGVVLSNNALQELVQRNNINIEELGRQIDRTAPRADNIRRVQEYLQEHGMGVIKSWTGARRINMVQNIVTFFSQDQEAHLQTVANLCNTLLADNGVYAGAVHSMLKGTGSEAASPILSREAYAPGHQLVNEAYDRRTRTVGQELEEAYREHLRANGYAPGTGNNDPIFQRNFLDQYHNERTRGFGFLRWLLGVLWGRQRDEVVGAGALNQITA